MAILRPHQLLSRCAIAVTALVLPTAAVAQNSVEKVFVGDAKVTPVAGYKGTEKLAMPTNIIVHDFDVPGEIITIDKSPLAHIMSNDPIAHMKHDAGQAQDPAAVARKVQAAFSKALLADLSKSTIPATQSPLGANSNPPAGTLIIRGSFTTIKQGDKTKRMMIGLGAGASDVQAHVVITLLTPDGPLLLSEFTVDSKSGKKPGAAESMGYGAAAGAAAGAAMDGKASVEGDTARMAHAVSKELKNIMAAQQWIAADAPEKQVDPAAQTP